MPIEDLSALDNEVPEKRPDLSPRIPDVLLTAEMPITPEIISKWEQRFMAAVVFENPPPPPLKVGQEYLGQVFDALHQEFPDRLHYLGVLFGIWFRANLKGILLREVVDTMRLFILDGHDNKDIRFENAKDVTRT